MKSWITLIATSFGISAIIIQSLSNRVYPEQLLLLTAFALLNLRLLLVKEVEWISLDKQRPEPGQIVDVISDNPEYGLINKRIAEVKYTESGFSFLELGIRITSVTHWRPIPDPPKRK